MLKLKVKTSPPSDCTTRWNGETWEEYFIRLFENKAAYNLTSEEIAGLLNAENGKDYGESAYRKRYAYFNEGRIYERNYKNKHVAQRILAISDLHVPYQLPVSTFGMYCGSVDVLVLNGDIMDCQSISRFPKKYRINFVEEMVSARKYMIELIDYINPKKVVITKGNHEHRLIRYLSDKLNEDILNLMPDSPIDLIVNDGFKDNDRINRVEIFYQPLREIFEGKNIPIIYENEWYCRIGNVIFAHPLAYADSMLRTAEKAVTYFSRSLKYRDFAAIVMAHTHKVGFYKLGDISIYEQGCCCKLDMLDYADGRLQNPQQNGYMYICLDDSGNIIEDKTKLITDIE